MALQSLQSACLTSAWKGSQMLWSFSHRFWERRKRCFAWWLPMQWEICITPPELLRARYARQNKRGSLRSPLFLGIWKPGLGSQALLLVGVECRWINPEHFPQTTGSAIWKKSSSHWRNIHWHLVQIQHNSMPLVMVYPPCIVREIMRQYNYRIIGSI